MKRKPRKITEPRPPPPRPSRPRIPVATLLRMFVLGSVAVCACLWALWRQHTVPRAPMRVPAPVEDAVAPAPAPTEIEIDTAPVP